MGKVVGEAVSLSIHGIQEQLILADMNKYQKAVAYINDVLCGLTHAEIAGLNNDIVYISTDVDDTRFRIHEDEVDAMAEKWNRMNPHTHD